MPSLDGASLNGLLTTPQVLGALAVLLALLLLLAFLRASVARRLLLPVTVLAIVSVGAMAILDRMAEADRFAERRALTQRDAELTAQALVPGSSLSCLDGGAGEAVENACEKMVFASPQNTAAAVAFMAARPRYSAGWRTPSSHRHSPPLRRRHHRGTKGSSHAPAPARSIRHRVA